MDRSIIQFWSQTSTSAGNQGPRGILRLITGSASGAAGFSQHPQGWPSQKKKNWLKAWLSSNNTRAFNPSIHRGNLDYGGWFGSITSMHSIFILQLSQSCFPQYFSIIFSQEIVDWPARWQEETAKAASEVMGQALLLDEKSSHLVTT